MAATVTLDATGEFDKSAHMYFQCEDESHNLILVNASLFTTPGNVSGWFTNVFGGKFKRPAPIAVNKADGVPIYYLPVPRKVMLEMLRAMRYPPLIEDMMRHVPLSLGNTLSLKAWIQYLEEYGLTPLPKVIRRISPAELRQRAREMLDEMEKKPPFQYARRVAEALVAEIKQKHPRYHEFQSGEKSTFTCSFIGACVNAPLDLTYRLDVPGQPLVAPLNVARYLGYSLRDGMINKKKPTQDYFALCIERALGEKVSVTIQLALKHSSKAKTAYYVTNWPSTPAHLTRGQYYVCSMAITHQSLLLTKEEATLREFERQIKRSETYVTDAIDSGSSSSSEDSDDSSDASNDEYD